METEQPLESKKEIANTDKEITLIKAFIEKATIRDIDSGYVYAPFVNEVIDSRLQGLAAELLISDIIGKEIEMDGVQVVGIPNSGIPLAAVVADRLGFSLVFGKKGEDIADAWERSVFIEKVPSYTKEGVETIVFSDLKRGDRVLLVDDVLAFGNTVLHIIPELIARGVEVVGLAVYFNKSFQLGWKEIEDLGVPVFSAVEISKIIKKRKGKKEKEKGHLSFELHHRP